MLYDGPYVLNEVAGQPGDEVWSIEVDGFVPHLDQVQRVLTPDMQGEPAQGETLATVDESLGLGRLTRNGAAARKATGTTVRRRLLAALALEAVGIGSKANELAIAYVSEREQFGKKIGTYQAISHSLVDGYVAVELARSLAYWAAWAVAENDGQVDLAVAARSRRRPRPPSLACEKSIQAHGGIGFTWEHPLHRYYKRAQWLEGALGYGREHRAEIAAIPSVARNRSVQRDRRGDRAPSCRARLAGLRVRPNAGRGARRDDELVLDVTRRGGDRRCGRRNRAPRRARRQRRDRDRRPLEFLPPDELSPPARGQRRRTAARDPGVPAGTAPARGRVVLMGSIAGRSALPFLGAYAMSKFALEAMADSLRVELAPWGIQVAIVEPGTIATPIWTKPQRSADALPAQATALYGARLEAFRPLRRSARRRARRRSRRSPRGRARAHFAEAEDALPGRPRREAARSRAAAPGPGTRPGASRFLFGN